MEDSRLSRGMYLWSEQTEKAVDRGERDRETRVRSKVVVVAVDEESPARTVPRSKGKWRLLVGALTLGLHCGGVVPTVRTTVRPSSGRLLPLHWSHSETLVPLSVGIHQHMFAEVTAVYSRCHWTSLSD